MDRKDLQIMEILAQNSRISNSTIADSIKLSKDSVAYRINKLEKENIIQNYSLFIDSRKLGFTRYQVLIQLNSNIDKEALFKKLESHSFIIWMNTFIGRYDLQIVFDAKNNMHYKKILDEIFELCSHKIRDHKTLITLNEITFTDLNPELNTGVRFKTKNDSSFSSIISKKNYAYGDNSKQILLTKQDLEILEQLSINPKITLIELSSKLKLDRKTVKKKINILIEQNVIQHFGCTINHSKFGYLNYAFFMKTKQGISLEKLSTSLQTLDNIFFAAQMTGEYDFIIYLYSKSPEQLNASVQKVKDKLKEDLIFADLFIQDKIIYWKQFTKGIKNLINLHNFS